MTTLRQAVETPNAVPAGHGLRLIGGRKVYPEWGYMWRDRSRNTCYVAGVAYADNWTTHEKSRRYLPDDTPVEIVPLPTR